MLDQQLTLRTAVEQSARRFPDRPALAMIDGEELTYAQLWQRVQDVSAFLLQRGVRHGDRVAILAENMPNWGVAYFGVTGMGAVAVPILPDFPAPDIARIIRHAEVSAVFVSNRLTGKLAGLDPSETGPVVLLEDWTEVSGAPEREEEAGPESARVSVLPSDRAAGAARTIPQRLPARDDLAAIVYTSGTTGHSKGVMLSHGNILADAEGTLQIVDIGKKDRLLSILPLSHTYECTLGFVTPILVGASISSIDKPPTAAVLLPALQRVKPTVICSVPLIIEKIYKGRVLPELTKSPLLRKAHGIPFFRKLLHRVAGKKLMKTFGGELRLFTIGGAPLAPDVELFLREARFPYAIGYGLTETSPLVAGTGPERTRYRSTGPALPGTMIRIVNANPVTREGEIQIKGPTVMKGYYKDPERTKQILGDDGWLSSGDLGVMDTDGFVFIKGRLKNMILGPSGKNIYPEEIEAVINEHDSVRESVVYEHQNRLVALVHLDYERLQKAIQSLGESDLRQKVAALLADLQKEINARVPFYARIHKMIEQAEPFQKTPTQKIKRHLYTPPL
ncbi:MAG TPA: AMP-binding protein [Bacteroidota bacterium]|nr:AMP-binding protein [Bacteroidota bacterium]